MGQLLDEFEQKLKEVIDLRTKTDLSEEDREAQEERLWKVANKLYKGMGDIETGLAMGVMDTLFSEPPKGQI